MDNIDHVSRAYADLEKQDKRIKQLEAEIDVLKKSEVCGEIELKSLKTENQRLKEAIKNGVQELRDADVWWADNIAGNLQKALEE